MKGAIWSPSYNQLLPIPSVLPISSIHNLSISEDRGIILSEKSELFELSLPSLTTHQIPTDIPISIITCFNSISLLIGSGQVYIYGIDSIKTGLLGDSTDEIFSPKNLNIQAYIIKGSLNNHAAVIDNEGNLYTWGKGLNGQLGRSEKNEFEPGLVDTKKLFRASEVVCGDNFTGILTDGCYVYVYGTIGTKGNSRKSLKASLPTSHPELERMTAIQIVAGADFISVLIENGEVFAYDSCMDLVKLPLPQNVSINCIASTRYQVYGIGEGEIVEWGSGPRKSESNYCELTTWNGRYYKLEKPYSQKVRIFSGTGKHFSMVFHGGRTAGAMPLGLKAQVINPYKWSSYVSKMIDNAFDSLEPSSVPRGSRLSNEGVFSDLERLYSVGDNENTIRKIIKYRKEHELTKILHKVFWSKVKVLLEYGFKGVKDQAIMKKMYEKTLAAALLNTPIEKIIQKNLMTCYLFAFKAVISYAEGVRNRNLMENERKSVLAQRMEEKLRGFLDVCCKRYYNHVLSGFSLIKELEMNRLQKQTAVLSFGQVIFNNLKSSKKRVLMLFRLNVNSQKSFKRLINRLILTVFRKTFPIIIQSSKSRITRSNTLNKAVKDVVKKLRLREIKIHFLRWKKFHEVGKNLQIKKKFYWQIGCKSLILVLTYAINKSCRESFFNIKSYKPRDFRTPLILFISKVKSIIVRKKKNTLKLLKSFTNLKKGLKKLVKFLSKSFKQHKRQVFKKIEFFSVTSYRTRNLQSCLTFNTTLSTFVNKRIQSVWNLLKTKVKEASLHIADGPSYSFFSPKILKQSGILRSKNPSVGFLETETKSFSDFNFTGEIRLKKQKSFTTSVNMPINKLSNSSSTLSLGKSLEATLLERTLKTRKIQDLQLRSVKKNSKPPLKPPWKPASTTSQKKIVINSNIRRSQYDNRLKERVKSHSKHASADISQHTSTPSLHSRASSRQNSNTNKVEKFQNLFTNIKFGVLILENARVSIINKKLFEGWCRVKYFNKYSPVPPAPRPLDPAPQLSWQSNLYKIGFEKLKQLAKNCNGREILRMLKVYNSYS